MDKEAERDANFADVTQKLETTLVCRTLREFCHVFVQIVSPHTFSAFRDRNIITEDEHKEAIATAPSEHVISDCLEKLYLHMCTCTTKSPVVIIEDFLQYIVQRQSQARSIIDVKTIKAKYGMYNIRRFLSCMFMLNMHAVPYFALGQKTWLMLLTAQHND